MFYINGGFLLVCFSRCLAFWGIPFQGNSGVMIPSFYPLQDNSLAELPLRDEKRQIHCLHLGGKNLSHHLYLCTAPVPVASVTTHSKAGFYLCYKFFRVN